MMPSAADILRVLRAEPLEEMWEDNKTPNIVGALNAGIGAGKKDYPLHTHVGASGKPGVCDTVVCKKWIEVKGAWTYKDAEGLVRNPNLEKHLFSEEASAIKDVRSKLPSLFGHPDVEWVGFLLACFWSTKYPLDPSLIQRFIDGGGLNHGWVAYQVEPWQPENRHLWIQLHYWERETAPAC